MGLAFAKKKKTHPLLDVLDCERHELSEVGSGKGVGLGRCAQESAQGRPSLFAQEGAGQCVLQLFRRHCAVCAARCCDCTAGCTGDTAAAHAERRLGHAHGCKVGWAAAAALLMRRAATTEVKGVMRVALMRQNERVWTCVLVVRGWD